VELRGFHHVAFVVPDADASAAWYAGVLGFALERRFAFAEAGVEIAHVAHPSGVRIELIQQAGSAPSPDAGRDAFGALHAQGAKHVGLLVDDADAALAALRARGVEVVHEVTAVEPAGVRNFWVRDDAGHLVEFNQWLPGGARGR
jgi:catechol 2,3-dioxygenase-like lactoylglutathione lyase family enzyme